MDSAYAQREGEQKDVAGHGLDKDQAKPQKAGDVALFRGVTGAQSTGGRVAVVVLFGAILVLLIVGGIRWSRSPRRRLEITADAIRYVQPDDRVAALSRQLGMSFASFYSTVGP